MLKLSNLVWDKEHFLGALIVSIVAVAMVAAVAAAAATALSASLKTADKCLLL